MRAGDEWVLAVPRARLFAPGYFQGIEAGAARWLERIFDPAHSRFLPRAHAENDPEWKQVIPYVILCCGAQVFLYRRGRGGSESRLAALHSIGLGGHIQAADESLFAAPGWAAYEAGRARELAEEVELAPANIASDRLVGLINDDSVEVGRVHVGLIHLLTLHRPEVASREAKISAAHFVDRRQLPGALELESWSQLCLAHWDELYRQPNWCGE